MSVEYSDSGLVVAAAVVFREILGVQHVLLAERLVGSYKGELHPPGGFVDVDEFPRNAAARELLEEAMVAVEVDQFIKSPRTKDFMYIYDRDSRLRHRFMPFNVVIWEADMGHPQRTNPALLGRWEWLPMYQYGSDLLHDERVPGNVQVLMWAAKRIADGKHELLT